MPTPPGSPRAEKKVQDEEKKIDSTLGKSENNSPSSDTKTSATFSEEVTITDAPDDDYESNSNSKSNSNSEKHSDSESNSQSKNLSDSDATSESDSEKNSKSNSTNKKQQAAQQQKEKPAFNFFGFPNVMPQNPLVPGFNFPSPNVMSQQNPIKPGFNFPSPNVMSQQNPIKPGFNFFASPNVRSQQNQTKPGIKVAPSHVMPQLDIFSLFPEANLKEGLSVCQSNDNHLHYIEKTDAGLILKTVENNPTALKLFFLGLVENKLKSESENKKKAKTFLNPLFEEIKKSQNVEQNQQDNDDDPEIYKSCTHQ